MSPVVLVGCVVSADPAGCPETGVPRRRSAAARFWADNACAAYRAVLTRKLNSVGTPQNLVGWQAVDRLKPGNPDRSGRIGQALNSLLTGPGAATDRLERFVAEAGGTLKEMGASGPLGMARLLGSCALMLQAPDSFTIIQTNLFEKACPLLLGTKFPSHTDEPARIRAGITLTEAVRDQLEEAGWAPRDLIDVQSFLWTTLMEGQASATDARFAELMGRALVQFESARAGPFGETTELWATMNALKARLEETSAVLGRPDILVKWSLGKVLMRRVGSFPRGFAHPST